MKKTRSILLLAISAVLGILAIGLVRGLSVPAAMPAALETKKIVVAAVTLKFGDKITQAALRELEFPLGSIPDGAFGDVAQLTTGEPRVALQTIHPGEPVLAAKVSGAGGRASLSSIIDPSMRAITIRVDDVSGAAGFILPSDRVDVMLTHSENQQAARTDVLLQDIKVLAIDQESNEHSDKPTVVKAVTLEVTPSDAQKISLARTIGTLSLALRNSASGAALPAHSISVSDLTGGAAKKPVPTGGRRVEIIRGATGTSYDLK